MIAYNHLTSISGQLYRYDAPNPTYQNSFDISGAPINGVKRIDFYYRFSDLIPSDGYVWRWEIFIDTYLYDSYIDLRNQEYTLYFRDLNNTVISSQVLQVDNSGIGYDGAMKVLHIWFKADNLPASVGGLQLACRFPNVSDNEAQNWLTFQGASSNLSYMRADDAYKYLADSIDNQTSEILNFFDQSLSNQDLYNSSSNNLHGGMTGTFGSEDTWWSGNRDRLTNAVQLPNGNLTIGMKVVGDLFGKIFAGNWAYISRVSLSLGYVALIIGGLGVVVGRSIRRR